MPSQQKLRWAELRVGLTVLFAVITLAVLIFLLSGVGWGEKIILRAYFADAGGLRVGAPVRLQGVDIGNVKRIRVVPGHQPYSVEVSMKVNTRYRFDLHKDSTATLTTSGVLGETFVNVDSRQARLGPVADGDVLKTVEQPDINDVVSSTQSTLVNLQALLNRTDRILTFVESGQGSLGKLIYDDTLYRQLNASVNEANKLITAISSGQGSVGKLVVSDEFYNKANASVDKLNDILDQINAGQGTIGKAFKDPALYNNANQAIARANELLAGINEGKGSLGKLAKDEAFARKLDDTITKLNVFAEKLNNGQGTAARLINDPSLYTNADKMLVETQQLVQAIRQNPKKYLTIRLKLF